MDLIKSMAYNTNLINCNGLKSGANQVQLHKIYTLSSTTAHDIYLINYAQDIYFIKKNGTRYGPHQLLSGATNCKKEKKKYQTQ